MDKFDPFSKLAGGDDTAIDQKLFQQKTPKQETDHPVKRSNDQPVTRSDGRRVKRQAFDVFDDQIESFYAIQLSEKKATGKKPTIGELAREAFDDLIKKKSA